ncbi:DUF5606 domain-containing protein [Bacteroidota bacterium]
MLKDILSISGYGGLYKFISQGRSGIIVESLEDKKRMNASASAKISALEDIAIFTDIEDIPLKDVFKAISEKENGGVSINHKSSANELKDYFTEVLPDYDRDRVYVSDIKKVINWYNILHKFEMLNFEEEESLETEVKPASPAGGEEKSEASPSSMEKKAKPAPKKKTAGTANAAKKKSANPADGKERPKK